MPYQQNQTIRTYTFESLQHAGIRHGIFTRLGGVSIPPWGSLNFGYTVGDNPQSVQQNHQLALESLGCDPHTVVDVSQVHGTAIHIVDRPPAQDHPKPRADAIITNQPGVPLFMRFADCVPILLYDPEKNIAAIAHAGWRGTLAKVAAATVRAMTERFGVTPKKIIAGIGPSICAACYEVGSEVAAAARVAFGDVASNFFQSYSSSSVSFDLWGANAFVLREAGVTQIEVAGICTAENPGEWYSYRGEKNGTGRFGAVITLA